MADRPMLRDHWHARDYPDRLVVVRDGAQHRPWWVYQGATRLGEYATHAEAITAADKLARDTAPRVWTTPDSSTQADYSLATGSA